MKNAHRSRHLSRHLFGFIAGLVILCLIVVIGCRPKETNENNSGVRSPGKAALVTVADFPETATNLFHDMDGGVALSPDEIKGRNTWMLWTADNNQFWDWIARFGFGSTDLLKMIDSRQRGVRFKEMGLMNQPGYQKGAKGDEFGLWLDQPTSGGGEPADIDPKVYGRATGILGLRLFPNPDFDEAAKKRWDANRYYSDPNYFNDKKLVRPYRVGMACAFCHIAFDPVRPPADPENPDWKNLNAYIGNQYYRQEKVFGNGMGEDSFVYQLFKASPPGTVDTSFIATDNLNNPRTMNAIYNVPARVGVASEETLGGGALDIPGNTARMKVPHILKDGADSVGLLGALSRVFVNIGEYHEEWLKDHNALVGGKKQRPFTVANARKNSVYWQATETRVENLAKYFLKAAQPHHLKNAPGGDKYLAADDAALKRGKLAFADNCAECHSSKRPPANLANLPHKQQEWFRQSALAPDFLENNYLSDDQRHPITLIGTNASSACATNSTRGHVWDNFSSETYKSLPSPGAVTVTNPFDRKQSQFKIPAGGTGYLRTPSLVSAWAGAPFFGNNALGIFTGDPSVPGRMKAFDDAAEKLLWPEKRPGTVWRTTQVSYLQIPTPYLPNALKVLDKEKQGFVKIGPIPAGTPIKLLANVNMEFTLNPFKAARLVKTAVRTKNDLLKIKIKRLNEAQSTALLKTLVPDLLALSKCPDFIEDHGHEFGTQLPDGDKRALIAFLKTM